MKRNIATCVATIIILPGGLEEKTPKLCPAIFLRDCKGGRGLEKKRKTESIKTSISARTHRAGHCSIMS